MEGKGGSREVVEGRIAALKLLGETYNLEKEVKTFNKTMTLTCK